MHRRKKRRTTGSMRLFRLLGGLLVTVFAAVCLIPFLVIISGSFSENLLLQKNGLHLLPQGFTTSAYAAIFHKPEKILTAFGVSVYITAVGTGVGLILLTMTAYVLSRKTFRYRGVISFYFYLTTLFNGGIVCTYIFYIRYYGLKDSFLAVILPGLLPVMYLLIMRSFVADIPEALIESARIDGAGELYIFFRIVLPLLKSGLATIGLFMALSYWNDWYNAMLYIRSSWKYPLQYYLYQSIQTQPLSSILAMTCVTMLPIFMLYPVLQKYFVRGIAIGAVKG